MMHEVNSNAQLDVRKTSERDFHANWLNCRLRCRERLLKFLSLRMRRSFNLVNVYTKVIVL